MAVPLPPGMAMLLPKGLVENTAEVYAEVASYPVLPPEKICEYWHVYTTTFRKLIDPTAHRLENFWWHVWGSDRRYLSGQALAKIYEEISKGPTFVPLRGPPNRFEGPPAPRFSAHELDRPRPGPSRVPQVGQPTVQGEDSKETHGREPGGNEPAIARPTTLQTRTSSSAKPPPTHSILKKPRGPSTSGPRPTARFISPHGSEDEESKEEDDEDETSSVSTAATGSEMNVRSPPAKSDKKPHHHQQHHHHHVGKKFVASAHSKRRPALPRRHSSQSSAGSEAGSREGASPSASRHLSAHRAPTLAEMRGVPAPMSQDSSGSSAQSDLHLSARVAGKRPATRLSPDKRTIHKDLGPDQVADQDLVARTRHAVPQKSSSDMLPPERPAPRNQGTPPTTQRPPLSHITGSPAPGAERMSRSRSHQEYQRPRRDDSVGRAPPHGLLASSISAMSNVAARGTFDSELPVTEPLMSPPLRPEMLPPGAIPISPAALPSRPSATSLLESRLTPTQPSSTPPVPFGRSKSQLTLLLEREKARGADSKPRNP